MPARHKFTGPFWRWLMPAIWVCWISVWPGMCAILWGQMCCECWWRVCNRPTIHGPLWAPPKGLVLRVLDGHSERLGPCQPYTADIFGQEAEGLSSEMLLRIQVRGREGLFALGSRDRLTYRPDQGTDLAAFLARVVERLVAAWAPI
ncbi:MAG: DUF484 family protein [Robiginitomaculum sp.]|nr:DUF484 family protein [Robiginitomaculum sp.]